ncbi:NaeI family type II restriction endonuclease [Corynebacterium sp. KPL2850]|uniref:NaeI family type II restriction endonuclease n=1 Tax=Corynebacterium sp. KPL2850 TaxID=3158318 RepID=UPI0032EBB0EC
MTTPHDPENAISLFIEAFQSVDPDGKRLAKVFRDSFDQIYDGQHTGRYSIEQLSKTESAHLGSIVEINIRREFDDIINDGEVMDFEIKDYEVDCKYSKSRFGWMIPSEALGHHGMLCHADDATSRFRVGFIKFDNSVLNKGGNRDGKRTVSAAGRKYITWLHFDEPFPPNTLLQLDPDDKDRILSLKSGAARLNELFRTAQEMRIPRGIVATVAQQKDYMKRIRYNGGSRSALQPEGIVILGDYNAHREIADALQLPIPGEGESLSVRLFPLQPDEDEKFVTIDGVNWRKARESDPIVTAPQIPFK